MIIKPNDFKFDQKSHSNTTTQQHPYQSNEKSSNESSSNNLVQDQRSSFTEKSCTIESTNLPIEQTQTSQLNQVNSLKNITTFNQKTASPQLNSILNINTNDFITQEMSPSSFLSADIESCSLSTGSNNNSNFATSASFDELMQNVCSNDVNEINTAKKLPDESLVSKVISIEFESVKITDDNKINTTNQSASSSSSLDELLKLRPKSIISSPSLPPTNSLKPIPLINNSKLTISKVVKSINTAPISLASMQQNKIFNLSSIAKKDDLIKKLTSVQPKQQQETKLTSLPPNMLSFQNVSSFKLNPAPNIQPNELTQNSPISKLANKTFDSTKGNAVIYKVSKIDVSDVKDTNEQSLMSSTNNSDLSSSGSSLLNDINNAIKKSVSNFN